MFETPPITIIIPVKPGGKVSALAALRNVEYPPQQLEVIVAEGRCPSRQRNMAAAEASGEFLYFLDDDSRVAPDICSRVVLHFTDSRVAVAGGPSLTPEGDSLLQHAFGMAFTSLIGGGGMRNRYRQSGRVRVTSDRELILCNLAFRREVFQACGGFDERLYPNEENELMERIRRGGGLLVHDPELFIYRSQRTTVKAFCRQLFGYGRGRGGQTVISGVSKPITFVPSLFVLYLLLLPLTHNLVYYLPLLCYLLSVCAVAAAAAYRTRRCFSGCLLPLVLPLFHLCYGLGMVSGLISPQFRKRRTPCCEVQIRMEKPFGGPWAG